MEREKTDRLTVIKYNGGKRESFQDVLIAEVPLTIFLDAEELVTILCTPELLRELAIGFLYSEGFIHEKEDIRGIDVDLGEYTVRVETRRGVVSGEGTPVAPGGPSPEGRAALLKRKLLITPGCVNAAVSVGRDGPAHDGGLKMVESGLALCAEEIVRTVREAHRRSRLYQETGGVHNAALCKGGGVIFFSEDIGRHNALDKVIGLALLAGIPREDTLVVTSGRISSAVVAKMVRAKVPVLVSRSAPTSEAVRLAEAFGITLIGFARGARFNVYSNSRRIEP
jgi:FdhD protein